MSKYTAFRCPEDLLELAKTKARAHRRSLSNYIITLIERDVSGIHQADGEMERSANGSKSGRTATV